MSGEGKDRPPLQPDHRLSSPAVIEMRGQPEDVVGGELPKIVDDQGNVTAQTFQAIIAAGSRDGADMMRDIQASRGSDEPGQTPKH